MVRKCNVHISLLIIISKCESLGVKEVLPFTTSLFKNKMCGEPLKRANTKKIESVDGEPFLQTVPVSLTSRLEENQYLCTFFPTKSLFRLWDMRKPFFAFFDRFRGAIKPERSSAKCHLSLAGPVGIL